MKFNKKLVSYRILDNNKEVINEIFQDLLRGKEVYFSITMNVSEIDKVFVSYYCHLKKTF